MHRSQPSPERQVVDRLAGRVFAETVRVYQKAVYEVQVMEVAGVHLNCNRRECDVAPQWMYHLHYSRHSEQMKVASEVHSSGRE